MVCGNEGREKEISTSVYEQCEQTTTQDSLPDTAFDIVDRFP